MRMKTKPRRTETPGRRSFPGGAAYRNRTDDLRITRRIRAVHGCPGSRICPARLAPHSIGVRGCPGPLLADPLALSIPAVAPMALHPGRAAPGRPAGPHARRVRGRRRYFVSESVRGRKPVVTAVRSSTSTTSPASSSRSQVAVQAASVAACPTCEGTSVSVRWCPPLAVAIVPHLVTHRLPSAGTLGRLTFRLSGFRSPSRTGNSGPLACSATGGARPSTRAYVDV
jgi:hypothetical protein